MDGIANVARQQQSQVSTPEAQGRASESTQQIQQQVDLVKEIQKESTEVSDTAPTVLNTKSDVEKLVKDLNKALEPLSTNLKFGVDSQDVFYVSVIEAKTNKMIRRFPAEKAQEFLPKMQEVSGILFDSKG